MRQCFKLDELDVSHLQYNHVDFTLVGSALSFLNYVSSKTFGKISATFCARLL